MTSTADHIIEKIREALEKVEVCEWFVDPMPMNNGLTRVDDGKSSGIFPIRGETFEMNYVVACNPQNIAALLAERDALRKALAPFANASRIELVGIDGRRVYCTKADLYTARTLAGDNHE